MAVVYILYSESADRFYTGSCADLEERLRQHKEKLFPESYTRQAEDWALYFSIDDLEYTQARKIEAHIKSMRNRCFFQNLKNYPELVEKLKARFVIKSTQNG